MTPILNNLHEFHILAWIVIIMVYGFLEMGIGIFGKTMFRRKKVRDATFYGITVPAMAGMYGALFEAVMQNHNFPDEENVAACAGDLLIKPRIERFQLHKALIGTA